MRRIDSSRLFVLRSGERLEKIFELGEGYDAVAYEHEGDWYLLGSGELARLRRKLPASFEAMRALGSRRKATIVRAGTKPTRPAVVVDIRGRVSAAWLPEPAGKKKRAVSGSPPLRGRPAPRRRRSAAPQVEGGGGGDAAPPDGDGPDGPGAETIYRTPHLDAPEEILKKPGAELTVSVYVDTKELRAGESGEGIELDLPPDVDSVEVGVLLLLTGPFELVEGSEFRTLTIARDEDESAKLDFKLRVTSADEPGLATIGALFTLRGRACGQVARHWDLAVADDKAPRIDTEAEAPVSMPLHIGAEQPSLSIFITAPGGGNAYKCAVQAPAMKGYQQPTSSEDYALPPDAADFRKRLLKALTDESRTPAARFRALGKIGLVAWEAAPQMVKDVLWKMIDEEVPPTTIYVQSVEPILPWELMIPRRTGPDGQLQKLGPLGVEFAVGRWTRGEPKSPAPHLRVDRSFVIAPTYSESRKLDFEGELSLIESKLRGKRIEPATIDDLDERFGREQASLLHFVCHGAAGKEDDDAIALDAGELLYAGEMETLDGFEALCQATHPLVFLNSCSTGQMVPSLAGGAGFPQSFGALGANAIIAPLWPVDDKLAGKIALELYEEALKPKAEPLAAILQTIRRRGYEEKDADTYAAYCFFGDPQARLELVEEAG
jgi:hypothetical protein